MSPTSIQLTQELLGNIYLRRLLLHPTPPLYQQPPLTAAGPPPAMTMATILSHDASEGAYPGGNSFNANVVMVLSVLLCVLICSLGLNSIIRCALRCLNLVASEPSHGETIPSSASARKVNTGIKKKVLKTFPTIQYSAGLKQPGLGTDCVICLAEFVSGERLRLLPKCNHGFHVRCIDRWLRSHSSCPTCRHCLVQTCQKIAGGCNSTSSQMSQIPSLQQDHMILNITPLGPEDLIRNY